MQVPLRYGRGTLTVDLPDHTRVLRMNPAAVVEDPTVAVHEALTNPLGSPTLSEIARGKRSVVVVVSDVTRPVPHRVLLPPMMSCLEEAGLPRESITILVATGLHRPNLGAELEEVLSPELVARYRVVNHNARDLDAHSLIGSTSLGVPAWVDREYLKADLKILTGLIEAHLMAGYSGGRKLVCPGICAAETIKVFHSPALLEHESATCGILEGNPVHQTSLEVARMAGVDFILNVTLNESRSLTGVFAGELEAAHLAGVAAVNKMIRVLIERPAQVVVTTCAGYPLDTTFYQSVKGLIGALPAVAEGGSLIMAVSLSEGIGGKEIVELLTSVDSWEELERKVLDPGFFMIDQWQAEELVRVLRKAEVVCYTDGIDHATLRRCHVKTTESVEAAVEAALGKHGEGASLYAIPEGPYVMPVVA